MPITMNAPDFAGLAGEDLNRLVDDARLAFLVDDSLRIRWVNHPLDGWGPGASLLAATSSPLRLFYERFFARALEADEPSDHEYECHTPTLFRRFRLRTYPLRGEGLLLVHTPVEERPHDAPASPPDETLYTDDHGLMHMCAHCRRVRRIDDPTHWDWVPMWLTDPPADVSHGLCEPCLAYHFPR